jgi:hypothetical protein
MSVRTIALIAATAIIAIACTATVSTEVFARVPAGTTGLHHHHHYHHQGTVRHSGQVRHPQTAAKPPATVGLGMVGSPYCRPYDYTYDPDHYCGASYIVSW